MSERQSKQFTMSMPQVAALATALLTVGGGTGWLAPKLAEAPVSELDVRVAKIEQDFANKMMLDSIGRVAASVCALRSQVSTMQLDMREMMDSVNSIGRRTAPAAYAPRAYRSSGMIVSLGVK